MNIKGLLCLLLLMSVVPLTHAADKPKKPVKEKFDLNQVIQTIAREQDTDPVIGIWSGAAGGYTWRTAITRNPNAASDGFEFVGYLLLQQRWPGFRNGEIQVLLNRTAAPGEYTGREKWKRGFLATWWETASFEIIDDYHLQQTNNINFNTPLGSVWRLLRELPPELTQRAADAPSAPAADAAGTREAEAALCKQTRAQRGLCVLRPSRPTHQRSFQNQTRHQSRRWHRLLHHRRRPTCPLLRLRRFH